jgi:hypothetical protein
MKGGSKGKSVVLSPKREAPKAKGAAKAARKKPPRCVLHDREKYKCYECGGAAFCVHGRQKQKCPDCKGANICAEHGKRKDTCKGCFDAGVAVSGLCKHGKNKYRRCPQCNP